MEKELKIAELAALWGVSVPTTWNRIRKNGLITFIKKDENNKDVNYVKISDEVINQYVVNTINNVNNVVNNGHYEVLLTDNNVNNDVNNLETQAEQPIKPDTLQDVINTITTVHNDYNERLQGVYNELITYKSQVLLLEDKAGREGMYIGEINALKKDNNRYKLYTKVLLTVITLLIIGIVGYTTYTLGQVQQKAEQPIQTAPLDGISAQKQ